MPRAGAVSWGSLRAALPQAHAWLQAVVYLTCEISEHSANNWHVNSPFGISRENRAFGAETAWGGEHRDMLEQWLQLLITMWFAGT